jgi:uncharacterized protein (TIGR03083 family)
MADVVAALRSSVGRLRDITQALPEGQLDSPAYPSEWSIADVLSHLGSGAVIMQRRLEDTLADRPTPDDFAPGVWDTWNAKSPTDQRTDALEADGSLLAAIEAVPTDERERFAMSMGPMTLGFDAFVGMRLNEHAFHTWDIEVAGDPTATIPTDVAELVVDNLDMIARFTAKPTGNSSIVTVTTTDPQRGFTIELVPDAVSFTATAPSATADLTLASDSFARLVYGRLDPEHTPPGDHGPELDLLRRVFPGP